MRKRTSPAGQERKIPTSAPSLQRGLEILRAFSAEDQTLGNQDLLDRTGLPKATVSRLTQTLVTLGYLHYDETLGRYSIGPATVSLGYSALSSNAVVRMARPLMQELADETGAAVAIGARDQLDMVYLANCRSMSPVTLNLNVGSRLPIWRTSMGLAYLANLDPESRGQILELVISDEPNQETLIRHLVDQAVDCFKARGFVASIGQWYSYINAVGVAFRPTDGSPMVALTCGGIVDILPQEKCQVEIGPKLVNLVQRRDTHLHGVQDDGLSNAVN